MTCGIFCEFTRMFLFRFCFSSAHCTTNFFPSRYCCGWTMDISNAFLSTILNVYVCGYHAAKHSHAIAKMTTAKENIKTDHSTHSMSNEYVPENVTGTCHEISNFVLRFDAIASKSYSHVCSSHSILINSQTHTQ